MTGGGVLNQPHIAMAFGVTGSGKSTWVKRTFLSPVPERLLIWDYSPVNEYARFGQVLPLRELCETAARCHKRGLTFRLVYHPKMCQRAELEQRFTVFCRLAMALGELTMVVEELRYVTQPWRAPDAWAHCVLTGRKMGLTIVATSQRPAHVDKDSLGNATLIHTGRLIYPDDVKAVSQAMICDPEQVRRLDFLEYIESDEQRALSSGRITF